MRDGASELTLIDFTDRIRAIAPQRLDLLLRGLNALRPQPAAGSSAARGTWLAEPLLAPLRFHGALDETALRRALGELAAELGFPGPALRVLDLRELAREERYGEALRAAGAEVSEGAPARAVLGRLDDAEHLMVLVLRSPGAPAPGALARQLQARYDGLLRAPAQPETQTPAPPAAPPGAELPARTAEALLAEVESFSDEDVELLLGQLEAGAGLRVARPASAPVDPASAEALLAEIDRLDDDDVDALLRQLSDV